MLKVRMTLWQKGRGPIPDIQSNMPSCTPSVGYMLSFSGNLESRSFWLVTGISVNVAHFTKISRWVIVLKVALYLYLRLRIRFWACVACNPMGVIEAEFTR